MPPPTYKWNVAHSGGTSAFTVDAAYPVVEDGHMVLKDAEHKPVFTAQPGLGCTFTRAGLTEPGASPALSLLPALAFPDGCRCAYTTTANFSSATPSARWYRDVNPGCQADHAEINGHVLVIRSAPGT